MDKQAPPVWSGLGSRPAQEGQQPQASATMSRGLPGLNLSRMPDDIDEHKHKFLT